MDSETKKDFFFYRDWKDRILFLSIVTGAFLLRLLYICQYRDNPTFAQPAMDPLYHVLWARAFVEGNSFMEGMPFFRAPLYPWFLGSCFSIFGENYFIPRIVQAAMGALSCGLVFVVGRRLFGRGVGAAAGIVAASYWLFLYFEGELLIVPLIVFLDLLFLWLLIRAHDVRSTPLYMASGLVLGLSALARPNILLFGLATCVWILFSDRGKGKISFARAFLFGLLCLVPILPVTIRNYTEGDDLVLISTQGGVNFYIGNNEKSDGTRAIVPGTPPDWWGGYFGTIAMAEEAEGRKLKPSEVSQHFFGRAFTFIREEPGDWLDLTGRKIRYFWTAAEISNNQPIRFFAERFGPVVKFLPIGFGLIAPLALLGLLLCFRKPGRLFPLWGFVLFYTASVVLFFVCTRFRVPVTPILIILACSAVRWLISAVRNGRWRGLSVGVLFLALAFWGVNDKPDNLADPDFQGHLILGDFACRGGNLDEAIGHFKAGLEKNPDFAPLHLQLGWALLQKGEEEKAERELELSLKGENASESFGPAAVRLAAIYAGRGETERAENLYRNVLELNPRIAEAHHGLSCLLVRSGFHKIDEAIGHLREAVRINPLFVDAHVLLGRLLCRNKDEEGIAILEKQVELHPGNAQLWSVLSMSYGEMGRRSDAIRAIKQALRLVSPQDPVADTLRTRLRRLQNLPAGRSNGPERD
jgi:Flp pilus assembly protein TadD/4-amino-4-deoxy-L-arabinose transferase-like glycosyltransferase